MDDLESGGQLIEPHKIRRWGRQTAQEKAIHQFNAELAQYPSDSVPLEHCERMLLRVFDAGYDFAARMATTDINVDDLALDPAQLEELPAVEEMFWDHSERHGLTSSQEIALFTTFIQSQGEAPVFQEYLKLVAAEKEKAQL